MYGLLHYSKSENPAIAYLRLNFTLPFLRHDMYFNT